MKVLITGSAGFIGFSLAERLLDKGHKVLGFDSLNSYYDTRLKISRNNILKKYKNYTFVKGKLENDAKLNRYILRFKPNIIIHLAAKTEVEKSFYYPRQRRI